MNQLWKCPRCNNKVIGHGSISRRDDKTKICSKCGISEALFDWKRSVAKENGKQLSIEEINSEKSWMEELK